jgi:hypothetical protein
MPTITITAADAEEIRATLEYKAANDDLDDELEVAYDNLEAAASRGGSFVELGLADATVIAECLEYENESGRLDEDSVLAYERLDQALLTSV